MDVAREKFVDGKRIAVGEGDQPFCSWTRQTRVALLICERLIWVSAQKVGKATGRRRDLAKNTPAYGGKESNKVTRWPKRHNTPQKGEIFSKAAAHGFGR